MGIGLGDLGDLLKAGHAFVESARTLARSIGLGDSGGRLVQTRRAGGMVARTYAVGNLKQRLVHVARKIRQGYTDPKVIEYTRQLLSRKTINGQWAVREKDWRAEVQTIFSHVRANVRYVHDPIGVDTFTRAWLVLSKHHAEDCDGVMIVLGAMLMAVGYRIRLRVIRTNDPDAQDWNHIYLLVQVDGKWMSLDASVSQPAGWEVPAEFVIWRRDFDLAV